MCYDLVMRKLTRQGIATYVAILMYLYFIVPLGLEHNNNITVIHSSRRICTKINHLGKDTEYLFFQLKIILIKSL